MLNVFDVIIMCFVVP